MASRSTQLGEILKAAREAAGVSQARLAELTNFSTSYICNLEKGRKEIHSWIIDAYEKVIGTEGLLAAGMEGDDMQRRAVIGALGTVASLGIADSRLLHEALRISLVSAFDGDDWMEIAQQHGQRFMTETPKQSQIQLARHLMLLRQHMKETDSAAARLATVRLMILHGMAVANLGDAGTAASWYRSARVAADRTGDLNLRRWVSGREAFRRGYEGAPPGEVLMLTRDVDALEAHLAKAQAYARLSERTQAMGAVEAALRTYSQSDKTEGTIYAFQPWRLALTIAYVYALLGDVNRSEDLVAQIQPPSGMVRWQAQLDMQRAVLLAKTGNREGARSLARQVMDSHPIEQRSVLVTHMWEEVHRA